MQSSILSQLIARKPALVRWGIFVGLGLAVVCAAVGGLTFAVGSSWAGSSVAILGMGIGVGWGVTFAIYLFTVSRPLAQLAQATEALAGTDAAALSDVLAAIAEGDLTRRLELRARPADVVGTTEVNRLSEGVGEIIARLGESASSLNSTTHEACQRLFYVGPDGYVQGQACGEAMGRAVGKGQVLIVTSSFEHAGLELRRKGFEGTPSRALPGHRDRSVHRKSVSGGRNAGRGRPDAQEVPPAGRRLRHGCRRRGGMGRRGRGTCGQDNPHLSRHRRRGDAVCDQGRHLGHDRSGPVRPGPRPGHPSVQPPGRRMAADRVANADLNGSRHSCQLRPVLAGRQGCHRIGGHGRAAPQADQGLRTTAPHRRPRGRGRGLLG